MNRFACLCALFLTVIPAYAQTATKPSSSGIFSSMVPMMLIMFVVIWLMMIRPEQKKQKQRQALLGNLQKGDKVLTSGGIYGIVGNIKEKSVMLKIGEGVTAEFTKSSVVSVLNDDGTEKTIDPKASGPQKQDTQGKK